MLQTDRITNSDKRNQVENMLKSEKYSTYSDNQIANLCLVTQPFVSKIRTELSSQGVKFDSKRECSDGRVIDITNIGKRYKEDKKQIWVDSSILWNSLEVGEKTTIASFSNDLEKSPSPKIKQTVSNFFRFLVKRGQAVKIERGAVIKKDNYVKKDHFSFGDGSVSKNTIDLINEIDINKKFTNNDFLKLYKEKFKKEISLGTVNRILMNSSDHGFLKREFLNDKGRPSIFCKLSNIPTSKYKVISSQRRKPKRKKHSKEISAFRNALNKFLKDKNISLADRIFDEDLKEFAISFNCSIKKVRSNLQVLRKKKGYKARTPSKIKVCKSTDIQECLASNNLFRSSNKQLPVSRAIIKMLTKKLPWEGGALLIGTPGPFFTATPELKNNNIFVDELAISLFLQETTEVPITIVVGNGKDPVKAQVKANYWRSLDMLYNKTVIELTTVDRDYYMYRVSDFAKQHKLSKVVLLTSGSWSGCETTNKKHNMDLNFKSPSERLITMFRNLHILALVRIDHMNFGLKYLHDGKIEDIKLPKENE